MTSASPAAAATRNVTDERDTKKEKQKSDAAAAAPAIDGAAAAAAPRRELRRLREGDAFILDINAGDRQCLMHARASSTIRVGHATVPMRPLLNAPFGACFELDARSKALVRCDPANPELDDDDDDNEEGGEGGEEESGDGAAAAAAPAKGGRGRAGEDPADELRNNASLQDGHGAAQALQHDAIDALRASGASGSEVVAALVAGSATFASKTALSQRKWVRRKARKHVLRVSIRRPSAAALAAHAARGRAGASGGGGGGGGGSSSHHSGGNAAIGCLRPEGVALLLNLGGVGPGARVLVVDGVGGLLAASVAERLGGHGLAVVAFGGSGGGGGGNGNGSERGNGSNNNNKRSRNSSGSGGGGGAPHSSSSSSFGSPPQLDSLRHVDISQEARDAVVTAPLAGLLEAAAEARRAGEKGGAAAAKGAGQDEGGGHEEERGGSEREGKPAAAPPAGAIKDPAGAERAAARKATNARRQSLARAAAARGFDAFVCAAPALCPTALLLRVAPLLAPSASFAMHVAWLQPAAELASAAMEGVSATRSRLSDNGNGADGDRGGGGGGGGGGGTEGEAEAAAQGVEAAPFAAAAVHLVEPWLRRYQVLPRRTHPEMWASGTGGYLVHGVSLPDGGAASCGGERAAVAAAAASAAAEKEAAEAAAGQAGAGAAKSAPSPVSAAAAAAEKKKNGVVVAPGNDEYDPELSD